MSAPAPRAASVRRILITIGVIGAAYVAVIMLQLSVVISPTATRLHGRTTDLLVDHDSIAAHLGRMREGLGQVARLIPSGSGTGRAVSQRDLAALTGRIRALLDRSTTMRATIEDATLPPAMRVLLAEAVEAETSAALTLLDALRMLQLGRPDAVYPFARSAGTLFDSTTALLASAQRVALVTVLDGEEGLLLDVRRLKLWSGAWSIGGLILLFTVTWLVRQRLYQPIDAMERAVRRITGGDLSAEVPVIRGDELGRLATHLNAMTGVLRDRVTAEVRRAENLTERFGRILDESSNEILLFDAASLRVIQANRGACANLGYTAEELAQLTVHDLFRDMPRHRLEADLDLLRGGDQPRLLMSIRQSRKDGSTYPVELSLQLSRSGSTPVFVAVADDATARHRARELNDRLRDFALAEQRTIGGGDLQVALRAINEMAADALGLARCAVWRMGDGRLVCLDRFVADGRTHETGAELLESEQPEYFRVLTEGRPMIASIDAEHPSAREFVAVHNGAADRMTELDVPVRAGGRLVGVVKMEKGAVAHRWSAEEQVFAGSVADLLSLAIEAAERLSLQHQLARAQKLDSIGQLAGGVAHDFNNLLTAILGNLEVGRRGLSPADSLDAVLAEAEQAARRAATLTRQLLTFARHQLVEPKVVDLNELTLNADRLLRRLIGENIVLTTQLDRTLRRVLVDPGQFEQVIVNLAVNARDAMPRGGRLTIETRNVTLDEAYAASHADARPGDYAQISISDNGIGMDRATVERIFEPFFTTKGPGRGTGLGLAVCYGIVRQAGGNIWVYSEVGKGTVVKVHLPTTERTIEAESIRVPRGAAVEKGGNETILVVEDEFMIRDLIVKTLSKQGYTVLAAAEGAAAVESAEARVGGIDLLVTDVVLPGMSGPQIGARLREKRPRLPVLYMSGYTADALPGFESGGTDVALISKPFTPDELSGRIREILDEVRNAAERDEGAPRQAPG